MAHAEPRHAVVAVALAAAAPVGVLAASGHAPHLLAAAAGVALVCGLWIWARRDPAMLLAALWAFQVVRTPLANGLPGAAGSAADQLTDVAALVLIGALAWELATPGAQRRDLRLLLPAAGLALCGVLSSLLAHAPVEPSIVGAWLTIKLWVLVGLAAALPWRSVDGERVFRVVLAFGAVAAALGLLDFASRGAVADLLRTNLEVTPFRYRADAAQSVYATPNEYCLAMSMFVAIAAARVASRKTPRDLVLLLLFIAAAAVSLRLKAVLSIGAVLAVVVTVQVLRARRGYAGLIAVAAVGLVVAIIAQGDLLARQVSTYSSSQPNVRSQLYDVGARIAEDRFPLGAGFGRFGSAPSRDHYSEVYDTYGLSTTWGLSREFPRFIADTSWPSIIGETGVAGLVVYVIGLLALVHIGIARLRAASDEEVFAPIALLCVVAVILVDSTGNSTLFTWNTSAPLAVAVGASLAVGRASRVSRPIAALRASGEPPRPAALRSRAPLAGAG